MMSIRRTLRLLCAALALVLLLSGCGAPQYIHPEEVIPVFEHSESSSADVQEDTTEQEDDVQYEEGSTPFSRHGALSVSGSELVDCNGRKYQLYGMSTHGLAWFPEYVSEETFLTLRDEWNTNCIRLALYTAESGGYCTSGSKEHLRDIVRSGVEYATELGMYVIIDWHVLDDENPLTYADEAVLFFEEMSALYADRDNIIYEICSEPNGTTKWADVTEYANRVIPVIRANDPNALIIVGTPTWSQDIDKALEEPLAFDNIMYSLHFYAGTHKYWLRSKLEDCIKGGLPVFISELGTCDSTGSGKVDYNQSEAWKELIDKYNLSYMCWNLANKDETCSVIKSSCDKLSGWTDEELTEHGLLVREWFTGEKNQ